MKQPDAGRTLRMARIFRRDGRTVIIALDHGAFMGPAPGWIDPGPTLEAVVDGGADAVMTTLGIAERYASLMAGRASLILSTPLVAETRGAVDSAIRLGADALKVFVTVGTQDDSKEMSYLWSTALECKKWSMPLLAEMFPVKSERTQNPTDRDVVAKFSRMGAEYGADFVKTFYTGSPETFKYVTDSCPVPVVILGGAKAETDRDFLQVVRDAMGAGAAGVAAGRNVWQHKDPKAMTKALVRIIHQKAEIEEALGAA